MPIFRWGNAYDAFRDLEREMDRLLQNVNWTFEGVRIGRQFPAVNIYDADGEYLLMAELPGARVEDLELSVAGGLLTMRGSRRDADVVADDRFRRSERPQGRWERTFSLPERIQEEEIRAELHHGLLKLHLPKTPSTEPRQIPVIDGQIE